jgi:hypothetical protein
MEVLGAASREVTAAGAGVFDEEGIPGEEGVPNLEGDTGGRVARRVDDLDAQRAGVEGLAVLQEAVELAPVRLEVRAQVEQALEGLLHHADVLADGHRGLEAALEPLRAGEVVGVGVRLQHHVQPQLMLLQEGRHLLQGLGGRLRGERVVVQDRVDEKRIPGGLIKDDVGEGVRLRVEEGLDSHGCHS